MTEEAFTPEEQEALTEMEADTGEEPTTPKEQASEIDGEQETPEVAAETEQTPEFKTTREKPPEGFVPHGALHAEREERKKLQAQLDEIKAWREAQEKPKDEPPQFVDPLEDPEGFRKWAEHSEQSRKQEQEERTRQQQETQQRQQRASEAQRLEQEFAAKTPDYKDAAQFMLESRVTELRNQGWGDDEIGRQIQQDANGIFDAAQTAGMNPAELLYYRAKATGYAPKAPQADQQAQRMQAQATAQRNTQGLGQGGGAPQQGGITADQLASMSDAEFAKVERENPDAIRRAMGG